MKLGDIYWMDLPTGRGQSQSGRRPVILFQDDLFANKSPMIVMIPLTTQAATQRFPAVVPVPMTATNGLSVDSFALVFQIAAVDKNWLRQRIGEVDAVILADFYVALDRLVGRYSVPNPSTSSTTTP